VRVEVGGLASCECPWISITELARSAQAVRQRRCAAGRRSGCGERPLWDELIEEAPGGINVPTVGVKTRTESTQAGPNARASAA
jgi:hypothetical protein